MSGRGVVEFRIEDMDCASCMATIRAGLNGQPGFVGMAGSPVSRSLTLEYDEHLTDPEALRRVIGDLGYRAHVADADSPASVEIWRSRRAVLTYVSGGFFLAGLLARILGGEGLASHSSGFGASPGLDGTLLLVAAAVGAWNFLPKAFGALRAGVLDMHVLMALAVVGAAAIGEYMEAGAIGFLFSLAELLEGFAVERASASVRSLMKLSPETAIVVRDGKEVQIRASEVEADEEVLVRPGERVPVDGASWRDRRQSMSRRSPGRRCLWTGVLETTYSPDPSCTRVFCACEASGALEIRRLRGWSGSSRTLSSGVRRARGSSSGSRECTHPSSRSQRSW